MSQWDIDGVSVLFVVVDTQNVQDEALPFDLRYTPLLPHHMKSHRCGGGDSARFGGTHPDEREIPVKNEARLWRCIRVGDDISESRHERHQRRLHRSFGKILRCSSDAIPFGAFCPGEGLSVQKGCTSTQMWRRLSSPGRSDDCTAPWQPDAVRRKKFLARQCGTPVLGRQ